MSGSLSVVPASDRISFERFVDLPYKTYRVYQKPVFAASGSS